MMTHTVTLQLRSLMEYLQLKLFKKGVGIDMTSISPTTRGKETRNCLQIIYEVSSLPLLESIPYYLKLDIMNYSPDH